MAILPGSDFDAGVEGMVTCERVPPKREARPEFHVETEVPSLHTNYSLAKLFIHCSSDEAVDRVRVGKEGA
ncbi:hypothetical protein DMN91_011755 [Ooceraea biroi]|uniref:Uncharacterized protein n=1 Tax=Ooceraea biroi TaxID=2015173 RepID=A0A3L8D699_OOCBI|nr:hypothetical protein DMN91_011755 [Ooceraea biroi]